MWLNLEILFIVIFSKYVEIQSGFAIDYHSPILDDKFDMPHHVVLLSFLTIVNIFTNCP